MKASCPQKMRQAKVPMTKVGKMSLLLATVWLLKTASQAKARFLSTQISKRVLVYGALTMKMSYKAPT